MKRVLTLLLLIGSLQMTAVADQMIQVVIQTTRGDIVLALNQTKAPITTKNFLRYVDAGKFTNGSFYRTVTTDPDNQPKKNIKIDVIQGGMTPWLPKFEDIDLERTTLTGLRHLDGTVSMARDGPNTAASEFFICVGDQPELDFGGRRNPDGQGFAAFGKVVSGMEVVLAIHKSKAEGQRLFPETMIQAVRRR